MDIYISVEIIVGIVMRNPKVLKFVPDHLKAKRMCKHAVKKLLFLIRYVSDQLRLNKCVIKLF